MQVYKNISGTSGIAAFETGFYFIKVEFHDGSIYLSIYTHACTGSENIDEMKKLADKGQGLTTIYK